MTVCQVHPNVLKVYTSKAIHAPLEQDYNYSLED